MVLLAFLYRLVVPVVRIDENVSAVACHLTLVALLAGTTQVDAARIVLRLSALTAAARAGVSFVAHLTLHRVLT
jgi:hypothetical protein